MKHLTAFVKKPWVRRMVMDIVAVMAALWVYEAIAAPLLEMTDSRFVSRSTQYEEVVHEERELIPVYLVGDDHDVASLSLQQMKQLAEPNVYTELIQDDTLHRITYHNDPIFSFVLSPDAKQGGFFHAGEHLGPFQVALVVIDVETKRVTQVYQAPMPRTSGWEWKDNDHVFVYRGCGTACRGIDVINVNTGERIDSYHDRAYEIRATEQWCGKPCELFPEWYE